MVDADAEGGGVPQDAKARGMSCFLEDSVAQEFVEDREATYPGTHSPTECCERVIESAIYDV
ncbi:MAG: hypothetical protein U0625_09820 [Phycisphaerales bacterium]